MRDLEPDTPRHVKQACHKRKRFGIEHYSRWFKKWRFWKWYATEKQRDQAFDMVIKHTCAVFKKPGYSPPEKMYRKVERQ